MSKEFIKVWCPVCETYIHATINGIIQHFEEHKLKGEKSQHGEKDTLLIPILERQPKRLFEAK